MEIKPQGSEVFVVRWATDKVEVGQTFRLKRLARRFRPTSRAGGEHHGDQAPDQRSLRGALGDRQTQEVSASGHLTEQ